MSKNQLQKDHRLDVMDYLSVCDKTGDDLPDGAWWAHMEDGVRHHNKTFRTRHDPYDTVLQWVKDHEIEVM